MRILALVVARGGSKRVPGKNLRLLGGRPLVQWTVDTARSVTELCDVLLSTDDPAIAEVGRARGALVPWLRPATLATDTATAVDVALHALNWYEHECGQVEGLLLLQPTSPFRTAQTVRRTIASFTEHHSRPVVAVAPAADHPLSSFRIVDDVLLPFVEGGGLELRSQDLQPAYVPSGTTYLITPADLRTRRSFYGPEVVPVVVDDPVERLDIDTPWDWTVAEAVVASRSGAWT
ncbi:MAG TPA: acylneuraminate cytidylyltransferase family protein [Gemmatimonadaceae bacterium]|nr:acylneuraminate cytidylyltransferase family protein [Gemmatimonadaceae bacterium]